jgi:hypothetical protein
MRKILFVLLLSFTVNGWASENQCHDADKIKEWEGIIAKHPTNPLLVKLYGMRIGLCKAVDDGKISLDTAIDVFETERSKLDKKQPSTALGYKDAAPKNVIPVNKTKAFHWFDMNWSKEEVPVDDTMTISGKFFTFQGWPETIYKPEISFLNVGVPSPVFIRAGSWIGGQLVPRSVSLELDLGNSGVTKPIDHVNCCIAGTCCYIKK